MKLSLTMNGRTHCVESNDDGQTVDQMASTFKGLLVGAGYHPGSVDRVIDVEEQWFPETQEDPDQLTLNWPGDFTNKHDQYQAYNQTT